MRQDFERGAPNGLETSLSHVSPLDINPANYMEHVDHFDMTEAQKLELLQHLFIIVRGFVEMGFTGNICEQIFGDSLIASPSDSGELNSRRNVEENGRKA